MKTLILIILVALVIISFNSPVQADTNMYPIKASDKVFFERLQKAVASNDAEWLSEAVSYPLIFKKVDRKITLTNSNDFKRDLAIILTPHLKSAIKEQPAASLFKNWQGVMAGKGAIWFSEVKEKTDKGEIWIYRIVGINPGK